MSTLLLHLDDNLIMQRWKKRLIYKTCAAQATAISNYRCLGIDPWIISITCFCRYAWSTTSLPQFGSDRGLADGNVSFKLLTGCLISKCWGDVMLTCCTMMESNIVSHVCDRKKDKVVFCDTIMPSAGSAGAAELSHQYWSSSISCREKGDRHWRWLICRICAPKFLWGSGWIQ